MPSVNSNMQVNKTYNHVNQEVFYRFVEEIATRGNMIVLNDFMNNPRLIRLVCMFIDEDEYIFNPIELQDKNPYIFRLNGLSSFCIISTINVLSKKTSPIRRLVYCPQKHRKNVVTCVKFFISIEDELIHIFGGIKLLLISGFCGFTPILNTIEHFI